MSLLAGCESWVGADLKPAVKLYNCCLKKLLGVRKSDCNDVFCVESGYPSLQDLCGTDNMFFPPVSGKRDHNLINNPLAFVTGLAQASGTCTSRLARKFVIINVTPLREAMTKVIN